MESTSALIPEDFCAVPMDNLQDQDHFTVGALQRLLMTYGGGPYPPAQESVQALYLAIKSDHFKGATLHGAMIKPLKGQLYFFRELRAVEKPLTVATFLKRPLPLWDDRFQLDLQDFSPHWVLQPLGQKGYVQWKQLNPCLPPQAPFPIPLTWPALFDGADLRALPLISKGFQRMTASFMPRYPLLRPLFISLLAP